MKFIVLGTSDMTRRCAEAVLDSGHAVIALVSMPKEVRPLNAADLERFAAASGISYHEIADINLPGNVNFLKDLHADYILSTWPEILRGPALGIPRNGAIGSHPTALPKNRGRHPLHWLIVLGYRETKLSFFQMDEGVDSGRILHQVPFEVRDDDTVSSLANRMNQAAYEGVKALCSKLVMSSIGHGRVQNHAEANYWRKRTVHDVTIDPRLSADAIVRTIRSFAPPYPGAVLIFERHALRVSRGHVVCESPSPDEIRGSEPGKILRVESQVIHMKAADAVVALEFESCVPPALAKASYIHPPSKYWAEFHGELNRVLH